MKSRIYTVLFTVVVFLLFYAGSCSRYHIEGYIDADRNEIGVNDTLYMEAVVTDEVEPYDVLWSMAPANEEADVVSPLPDDPEESEYNAFFVARKAGDYRVFITFLYKNTAPKDSDTLFVKVR